jgi:hypothetical protein
VGFLYCVPVSGGTMCVRLCACVRMGGWLSVGGGLLSGECDVPVMQTWVAGCKYECACVSCLFGQA